MGYITEIFQTARRKELKREQRVASLAPGPKHPEMEEVNQMVDNCDSFYEDTHEDCGQDCEECRDKRIDRAESLMDAAKGN